MTFPTLRQLEQDLRPKKVKDIADRAMEGTLPADPADESTPVEQLPQYAHLFARDTSDDGYDDVFGSVDRTAVNENGIDGGGVGFRAPAGLRDEVLAAGPTELLMPTAEEPMRGLVHLSKVAVVGSKPLRALASAPVLYIWDGIAILGIIVVIAGKVGCGKTTLLFLVLVARANAGEPIDVLGRAVTPAPKGTYVVLIEGEHGESSTARKLVRMCTVAGITDVDAALDRIIVVARKAVRIGSPEWKDVERMIEAGLVSDVALDTIARVAPGDANSESEQIAIFDRIAQAVDRAPDPSLKPVVWCAAHMRKGEEDDLDAVSGSTQRTGQADTVLMVKAERSDGRVTSSKVTFQKLREEPDEYPEPVEFTVTKETIVIVGTPEKDERPLEERILGRLALRPHTKTALAEALGRSRADLEEPISNLFAARSISTTDISVRGQTRKAFCLRQGAE